MFFSSSSDSTCELVEDEFDLNKNVFVQTWTEGVSC